ncbi:MAG: hypothetical protein ACLFTK_15895 [Anaerolineales bacterium]
MPFSKLRRYQLEVKYSFLATLSIGVLVFLFSQQVLDTLMIDIMRNLMYLVQLGLVGMFLIAFVGSATIIVQLPYNLPLFAIAIQLYSLENLIVVGTIVGLGAGLGQSFGYFILYNVSHRVRTLPNSALVRWTSRVIQSRPRFIPWLIFLFGITPSQDNVITVPLAVSRYPIWKFAVPMVASRMLHNIGLCVLLYYVADYMEIGEGGSDTVSVLISLSLALIFVWVIVYQIEKARQAQRRVETAPPA